MPGGTDTCAICRQPACDDPEPARIDASKLRVLIACEFSATVRDAFRRRGFSAWSCDILPTEGEPEWHIQDNVLHVLARDPWWDLVIAHPPCTFLTYAGAKHLYIGGRLENGRDEARWASMRDAAEFLRTFLSLPCPVAIENPIMLAEARAIVGRKYDQIIQPWQFGHGEVKRTCLWLSGGLPPLKPTHAENPGLFEQKAPRERIPRVHYCAPGPDRWKNRSRTLPGIAAAMADQWGDHIRKSLIATPAFPFRAGQPGAGAGNAGPAFVATPHRKDSL